MTSLSIDSYTVWILVDGESSPVYEPRVLNRTSATCWISSHAGKSFSVNWSNAYRDRSILAELTIDGVLCSTHFMLDAMSYPSDPSAIGVSYATTSDFTQRDFVFAPIEVTDDDAYLHTLDAPPAFGVIKLELWEADIRNVRRTEFRHQYGSTVLEGQTIHERSKKAGAHHVKFGGEYVVAPRQVNMIDAQRKGSEALATFTFNYRPRDILMAGGIISSPVPSPVKTEPVDSQILGLEAQLRALRAQKSAGSAPRVSTMAHPRTGQSVQVIDLTDL